MIASRDSCTEVGPGWLVSATGSVVLLDFRASWCPWCVKEAPDVNRIDANYDKVIVGVDDEDAATIAKARAQMNLGFRTITDANGAIVQSFGVDGLPCSAVIDAQGKVGAVVEGYRAENTLEQAVKSAL
jgi:cytochrome c biogenesis protein CcmG, thiol:disulfide interchange protein DsbE